MDQQTAHFHSTHARWSVPHGLTLVEMLFAIVVLGILVALALPHFASRSGAHARERQAREIHAVLAHARARAVAEQQTQRFLLTGDLRFRLEARAAGDWIPYQTSAPLDVPVRLVGGNGGGAVSFLPDGRVEAPATIIVGTAPHEHSIEILAGGLARWSGPSP